MSLPPNQTLYVSNINEKIKKKELRESLYFLFTQFGRVIDVVALKTIRERGQAFVVFEDVAGATSALRALQGFAFYGKNIKIAYAKTKSNAVRLRDGTYFQREKRSLDDGGEHAAKRQRQEVVALEHVEEAQILLVTNLPPKMTEEALGNLFMQHKGFTEVRLVPGKDVAFVEYDNRSHAETALTVLDGFEIVAGHPMKVQFAK
ncbi:hypothetical protein EDD86DRAFT_186821 [Gorgonomyces haynaldii]|nr:hypothetical protein EDD86DRAFT_186821 [Gorgonomyces haynaldii]